MIRGVIFDLDGVLVTTDELHYRAWRRLADEEKIPFDRTVNQRLRGIGRMESLEVLLEKARCSYSSEEKTALAERKNSYYRDLLRALTPADVLPGSLRILRELRARGIKVAVGSVSKNTPIIMERVGLADEVDIVVDGNDISRSKPDPEVFLIAAKRMGLKPEECVVVEDAAAGIEAGRRAGMAVFAIGTRELHKDVERVERGLADLSVHDLLESVASGAQAGQRATSQL